MVDLLVNVFSLGRRFLSCGKDRKSGNIQGRVHATMPGAPHLIYTKARQESWFPPLNPVNVSDALFPSRHL